MYVLLLLAAQVGQFDKFEDREPFADYKSAQRLENVERCLIGMGGLPYVYRQPDRPDDVSLVWLTAPGEYGVAAGRIDLHRESNGTAVKSWLKTPHLQRCAPVDQ